MRLTSLSDAIRRPAGDTKNGWHQGWKILILVLSIIDFIWLTLTCVQHFLNILLIECGLLSMDSKPGLRVWYQNFIWTSIIESSPKAFSVIWIVYANECASLKKNLMLWIQWSHSTQVSSMACIYKIISDRVYAVTSPLIWSQVTSRTCNQFSRYSKYPDTFRTVFVLYI